MKLKILFSVIALIICTAQSETSQGDKLYSAKQIVNQEGQDKNIRLENQIPIQTLSSSIIQSTEITKREEEASEIIIPKQDLIQIEKIELTQKVNRNKSNIQQKRQILIVSNQRYNANKNSQNFAAQNLLQNSQDKILEKNVPYKEDLNIEGKTHIMSDLQLNQTKNEVINEPEIKIIKIQDKKEEFLQKKSDSFISQTTIKQDINTKTDESETKSLGLNILKENQLTSDEKQVITDTNRIQISQKIQKVDKIEELITTPINRNQDDIKITPISQNQSSKDKSIVLNSLPIDSQLSNQNIEDQNTQNIEGELLKMDSSEQKVALPNPTVEINYLLEHQSSVKSPQLLQLKQQSQKLSKQNTDNGEKQLYIAVIKIKNQKQIEIQEQENKNIINQFEINNNEHLSLSNTFSQTSQHSLSLDNSLSSVTTNDYQIGFKGKQQLVSQSQIIQPKSLSRQLPEYNPINHDPELPKDKLMDTQTIIVLIILTFISSIPVVRQIRSRENQKEAPINPTNTTGKNQSQEAIEQGYSYIEDGTGLQIGA